MPMSLNDNAGSRTCTYRDFWTAKCGKIESDQCSDRAGAGDCVGYFREQRQILYIKRWNCFRWDRWLLIDTPGIDDEGELGELRVKKSYQVLNKTDLAILVCSAEEGIAGEDIRLLERIQSKKIPWILVMNKTDLIKKEDQKLPIEILKKFEKEESDVSALWVSAEKGEQIYELKEQIAGKAQKGKKEKPLVSDLLSTGDCVVLVIPIDKAAPKGRLILPQQQTIRDALEAGASVMVTRDHELQKTLEALKEPPKMVITDSQVFGKVAKLTPKKVLLTSFSILFARYKGELRTQVNGAKKLDSIQDRGSYSGL